MNLQVSTPRWSQRVWTKLAHGVVWLAQLCNSYVLDSIRQPRRHDVRPVWQILAGMMELQKFFLYIYMYIYIYMFLCIHIYIYIYVYIYV